MATAREVKLRIRSVKNIAQITRALQAVSASKVQRAIAQVEATRPYATKAWEVLTHLATQPGREHMHPLMTRRSEIKNTIVAVITSDRGLAGPYNTNILRFVLKRFSDYPTPVHYVTIGKKGREVLHRRGKHIIADFSGIPDRPKFGDVSHIGRLLVEEFLEGRADEIYLIYTDFINMLRQNPTAKKLLPLEVDSGEQRVQQFATGKRVVPAYIYEPSDQEILDVIVPRFTELQIYHAVLESQASEHAARMVAMKNATDNATELADALQLEYNKARQASITREMLDIAGGAEAMAQAMAEKARKAAAKAAER